YKCDDVRKLPAISSSCERCTMNQRLMFWSKYTRISVRNTPNAFVARLMAGPRPKTWLAASTDGKAGTPADVEIWTASFPPSRTKPGPTATLGLGGSVLNWLPLFANRWSRCESALKPVVPVGLTRARLLTAGDAVVANSLAPGWDACGTSRGVARGTSA